MSEIPNRDKGYSVETNATVHERYQNHAPNAHKVRSIDGAYNVAKGQELVPCPTCFPVQEAVPSVEGDSDVWATRSYRRRDYAETTTDTVNNEPTETVSAEWRDQ